MMKQYKQKSNFKQKIKLKLNQNRIKLIIIIKIHINLISRIQKGFKNCLVFQKQILMPCFLLFLHNYFFKIIFIQMIYTQLTKLFKNTSVYHSPVKQTNQNQIVFLCFHGAGSSALTFCQLTKQLKNMKYQVFAYDILGHGQTKNYTDTNQYPLNLSIKMLIDQGLGVYMQLKNLNPKKQFVFVGHSLGGSICCRVAKIILQEQQSNTNLLSVFIIDSIQGTAKQKFKQMEDLYCQFPQQFSCIQSAISWTKRSHLIRRAQSARSSVPSQLIKVSTIKSEQSSSELKKQSQKECYKWKVNMLDTISYWQQWYDGLSKIIVKLPIEKILFTLNKERLDEVLREEIERQENGMKVWYFSYSGHFIHQDQYQKCAQIIDDQLKLAKQNFV